MNQKFFALLAASALAFSFACSDDETTASTSTTSNGGNGTGGDATGGNGTGGTAQAECTYMGEARPAPGDCDAACDILFCCSMGDRCEGLSAADKDAFVEGCLLGCADNMALVSVVNGENCDSTVSTIKSVNASFEASCDGTGTGGAGGGTGGAGGAGGN